MKIIRKYKIKKIYSGYAGIRTRTFYGDNFMQNRNIYEWPSRNHWQSQLSAVSPECAVLTERVHDCWCGAQWGLSYSDFAIAASNNSVNCSTIELFRAYLDTI